MTMRRPLKNKNREMKAIWGLDFIGFGREREREGASYRSTHVTRKEEAIDLEMGGSVSLAWREREKQSCLYIVGGEPKNPERDEVVFELSQTITFIMEESFV